MRPNHKSQTNRSFFDGLLEVIGWIALILLWLLILFNYSGLPETIPIHYNSAGEADNYGPKNTLFLLPILGTILYVGLTFLKKFPHMFNYLVQITPENATRQYENAIRLMRYLKAVMLMVLTFLVYKTIQNATGKSEGLGSWFFPVVLAVFIIPTGIFIVRSFRKK